MGNQRNWFSSTFLPQQSMVTCLCCRRNFPTSHFKNLRIRQGEAYWTFTKAQLFCVLRYKFSYDHWFPSLPSQLWDHWPPGGKQAHITLQTKDPSIKWMTLRRGIACDRLIGLSKRKCNKFMFSITNIASWL